MSWRHSTFVTRPSGYLEEDAKCTAACDCGKLDLGGSRADVCRFTAISSTNSSRPGGPATATAAVFMHAPTSKPWGAARQLFTACEPNLNVSSLPWIYQRLPSSSTCPGPLEVPSGCRQDELATPACMPRSHPAANQTLRGRRAADHTLRNPQAPASPWDRLRRSPQFKPNLLFRRLRGCPLSSDTPISL